MFLSSTLTFSSLQSATYHAGCCSLSLFLPFFFTEHSRLCSVSLLAPYPSCESCTALEHICGVGPGPLVQEALSTGYPPERLSFQAPGSSAPYSATIWTLSHLTRKPQALSGMSQPSSLLLAAGLLLDLTAAPASEISPEGTLPCLISATVSSPHQCLEHKSRQ